MFECSFDHAHSVHLQVVRGGTLETEAQCGLRLRLAWNSRVCLQKAILGNSQVSEPLEERFLFPETAKPWPPTYRIQTCRPLVIASLLITSQLLLMASWPMDLWTSRLAACTSRGCEVRVRSHGHLDSIELRSLTDSQAMRAMRAMSRKSS